MRLRLPNGPRFRAWPLIAVVTVALTVAACGSSAGDGDAAADGTSPGAVTVSGSGSSFADGLYQPLVAAMADRHPTVTVNYNPVGSGQGKKDFAAGLTDFAGTDSLVKPEEAPAGTYLYVPTAAAPVTVSYNLDVNGLRLTPETLARIFQRDVRNWDDPAVQADNPGVDLPSTSIVVVHRADGSGTTSAFTKYLAKAAGSVWKLGAGDTVAWPDGTQAGLKNTGVAQLVDQTAGAIGYVDFADAKATGLRFAKIRNKDGAFVAAALDAASAALAGATATPELTLDALDAAGPGSYPITAVTYILVRPTYDAKMGAGVKAFVEYVLTDGQDQAVDLDYARLPAGVAKQALAQLDKVTVG